MIIMLQCTEICLSLYLVLGVCHYSILMCSNMDLDPAMTEPVGMILQPALDYVCLPVCRDCQGCRWWKEDTGYLQNPLPSTCPQAPQRHDRVSNPRNNWARNLPEWIRTIVGISCPWYLSSWLYITLSKGISSLSQAEIKTCEPSHHFL